MDRRNAILTLGTVILSPVALVKALSSTQEDVLQFARDYGRPHDFEWTLAAIALKESSLGKEVENHGDGKLGSYGIFGNQLSMVCKRTGFSEEVAKDKLINVKEFAAWCAVAELYYWKTLHEWKGWEHLWAHYNAGFDYRKGLKYAEDIARKINQLRGE